MAQPIVFRDDFKINVSVNVDRQDEPSVKALTNGRFAVAWTDNVTNVNDDDVRFATRKADGETIGGAGVDDVLRGDAVADESRTSIASLPDGRFVFVWEEQNSGAEADLYAQVRNPDGTIFRDRFLLTTIAVNSNDDQQRPEVIGLANGNFMVVYDDVTAGNLLRMQVYDIAGNQIVAPTTISTTTNLAFAQNRPDLALLADGNVAIAWTASVGGIAQQQLSIVRPNGTIALAAIDMNPEDTTAELFGGVAVLADGNIVVVTERDADAIDIQGRLFSPTGVALGPRFNISTGGADSEVRVAALADGRFMVVYDNDFDVFGQMMFANGTRDGAQFVVSNGSNSQVEPELDVLADGRVVVTWTDFRTGTADIFAKILDPRELGVRLAGTAQGDDLIGTRFDDTMIGGNGSDTLTGGDGSDIVDGQNGRDFVDGGNGSDWVYGGADDDVVFGDDQSVLGQDGDDNLFGGWGADVHNGGGGNFDYARYDDLFYGDVTVSLVNAVNAALGTSAARGDTFSNVEGLIMGAGNDFAYGDNNANSLYGQQGNDNIFGSNGADAIDGGTGFDYARFDDASYGAVTTDLSNAVAGTASAAGDTYANIEGLILTGFGDTAFGDNSFNYLYGLGGADTLDGRGGADNLIGGIGNDTLTGGTGNDVFWFRAGDGRDGVTDFTGGTGAGDQANLQGVFANFAAVLAACVQVGADLEIRVNANDVLILRNFNISNFAADDVVI